MKTLVPLLTVLLLVAACSDSSDSMPLAPEALNLSFVGYGGTVDGVLPSATLVDYSSIFTSTNAANILNQKPNVTWNSNDAQIGTVPLRFAGANLFGCFEYRIDDEVATANNNNFSLITVGSWNQFCSSFEPPEPDPTRVLAATSHVDVRYLGGFLGDSDSFDWTRFYAMTLNSRDQCKDGSWQDLGFQNQGQCIRFMETGKDSR